ncbi:MAG TPA: hypothetical protein VF905_14140 [Nitrospirota bacterium]
MDLSVAERYVLLDILPKEGTYSTLKILHQLRQSLSFSEEEVKEFGIIETVLPDGRNSVSWNPEIQNSVDLRIGEQATFLIMQALKNLDKNEKLTEREFGLYEKFVNGTH